MLIQIIEKDGIQVVSAREVFEKLGANKGQWSRWVKRNITENKFAFKDKDYTPLDHRSNPELNDFALTMDMGYRIAMMARTKKGEEVRNYFIEIEKESKTPKNEDQLLLEAMGILTKRVEQTQVQLQQANDTIKQQAPAVVFVQEVLKSESCHTITIIAKELGMSAISLNRKLNELGIQYKQRDTWVLYQKYQDKGYTKTQTSTYVDHTGKEQTTIHTVWTERGRAFIHHKLNPVLQTN